MKIPVPFQPNLNLNNSPMELTQTYRAVERLLCLLRCDHCNAPLHQPFTTGVCEHLLCPKCSPSQTNFKKSSCCQVCQVPVHPRDCQLHPQIANLVLVARRLKRLSVSTSRSILKPESINKGFTDAGLQNSPAGVTSDGAGSLEEDISPKITIKRAYSVSTDGRHIVKSPKAKVTLMASLSRRRKPAGSADSTSLANSIGGVTLASVGSGISVTLKPRLSRRHSRSLNRSGESGGHVAQLLPAYSRSGHPPLASTMPAREQKKSASPRSLEYKSESMELMLKAAMQSRSARRSLRRAGSARPSQEESKKPEGSQLAPIASSEPSRCTPDTPGLKSSTVALSRVDQPVVSIPSTSTVDPKSARSRSSSALGCSRVRPRRLAKHRREVIALASSSSASLGKRSLDTKQKKTPAKTPVRATPSGSGSGLLRFVKQLRSNSKGETALHRAAIRGNVDQVRRLLASKLSPNVRDHAGWTPLHEAALHGHCQVVETLLEAGAVVDIPGGPDLDTPLHDAVQNLQLACCRLLLAHGANPLVPNATGQTALAMVVRAMTSAAATSGAADKPTRGSQARGGDREVLVAELHDCLRAATAKAETGAGDGGVGNRLAVAPVSHNLAAAAAAASTFKERRRLRPVLLATGLSRPQQSVFVRVAGLIHASVAANISPEVTHVITGMTAFEPVDSRRPAKRRPSADDSVDSLKPKETMIAQTTCPRTLKFLNAVLMGCWVLSFDWIETCAHVNMRVEEEGFEVTGCSTTPHSGAPRRARFAREAGSLGLFQGVRVCFLGDFVYPMPPRDELVSLARSGSATVVFSRPRCSALRLARLATADSQHWEVNVGHRQGSADVTHGDEEDFEAERDGPPMTAGAGPLLVIYDSKCEQKGGQSAGTQPLPYAVQVVTDALCLIRVTSERAGTPVPENPLSSTGPPLCAVPATWLLDCAAEYRLLPLPS